MSLARTASPCQPQATSQNALRQDESKITKFQTGGPDGDLGSNEILVSKDNTIAPWQL